MNTTTERGRHRTESAPWRVRLACWLNGHDPVALGNGYVLCTRCERLATSAVRLP